MKRKILFMVQIPPPVHGASLRNLSLYESDLLHRHFNIQLLPLAFADSIAEIGKFSFTKIFRSGRYAVDLISTLLKFKPDAAYFTITPAGAAFYRDSVFVLILKLFQIPIIYHLRGLGVHAARHKNAFNKLLYSFVFRRTYVVCLSKKQLADVKNLPYRKHFIVPNGIKVEINCEDLQSIKRRKVSLLYLSNFVKSKGVFEFLKALLELKNQGIDFEAMVVGADSDVTQHDIQKFIERNNLNEHLTVRGPAYGEEKFSILNNCDIFVFPTYYSFELFPGVILEAMQCHKPVVSTRHAVIDDIIDDGLTGLLVEPRNGRQLAEKIKYLIKHPSKAKAMGERGGEKFYEHYTLDKFEQNIKSVFQEVLALRKKRG